mmetsp:Transcript_10166/g.30538  ORF Transcript_10166/g.30538 Transcript_10166/m.30538 type:complete len:252 (-) Transcript_10166:638-1393(-)
MPYCMRPLSKARCMRSSVTISRMVLYHRTGLNLRMTGQGFHTPTQMECRQLSMVGAVQSAVSTSFSFPVPSMRRAYSSMDTKKGWAHSLYRKSSSAFSSLVNGVSRVSSRWHHVAITRVPPGFSTRTISSTYSFLSGMCSPLSQAHTRSKLSSGQSILSASMTWKCTLSTPCSWASSVPRFTWAGDSVIPSTEALLNFLARWREVPPKPHPTSSTRVGAVAPAHFNISSQKSNLAALKSFFLYPRFLSSSV